MEVRNILVTGASGFIGRHVVPELERRGHRVRGMIRRGGQRPPWLESVETVEADLLDKDSLNSACKDMDTIVHLAARLNVPVETKEEKELLWKVNLDGTANLLDAAEAAGAGEFVFVSSVAAMGSPPHGETWDESAGENPDRVYGRSKLEAERLVERAGEEWSMKYVILRPVIVYGEGDKGNVLKMFRAIRRKRFFILGEGSARKSLVYAGNVAKAISHIIPIREEWNGKKYILTDERPYTILEMAEAMARALSMNPRFLRLPAGPFIVASGIMDFLLKPFHISPIFSRHNLEKFLRDMVFSGDKFQADTGFRPPVCLEEALKKTARWLIEEENQ